MEGSIREAGEGEIGTLAALIRAAFAEYEGRLDPPSSAHGKTEDAVRAELAGGAALVYERDGAIIGCVFLHPQGDHLYLDRLAVLPGHRGRGIGRVLLEAAERRARELGLGRVQLSVRLALADNRAYYERHGYHLLRYGSHPGYSTPTYARLEKLLPVIPV
jgi:N-acetylglutamate synthase-like GNAT family acetyltransferase